jgi:uncharacterized RDD family membrane protein YckC
MNNIANPAQRFLAHVLDLFINLTVFLIFVYLVSGVGEPVELLGKVSAYLVFLIFVFPILYSFLSAWFISTLGGTPGKLLTGISIVGPDGKNLSFWRAFFRNYIGYMVSGVLMGAGFVWIIIDKERRGWHDQIADTYVVVKNKTLSVVGFIFLVILIFLQILLISNSIGRFKSNGEVYTDIVGEISSENN